MIGSASTDAGTVPSEGDVEALYDRLLGTPALDAVEEDTEAPSGPAFSGRKSWAKATRATSLSIWRRAS